MENKEIKKEVDLEYLQIKVYLHFLEDLIFHQMDNYFYYQLGNGKELTIQPHNSVHSYIVKIS